MAICSKLGHQDETLAAYDKGPWRLNLMMQTLVTAKGIALSALGRNDEAVSAYDKALKIFESFDSPHTNMVRETLDKMKSRK